MKNILYDGYKGIRLPKEVQMKRVQRVIEEELTPLQREALIAYYIQGQTIPEIARDRGVQKSTISRTLHRAEDKLRRFLKYSHRRCVPSPGGKVDSKLATLGQF